MNRDINELLKEWPYDPYDERNNYRTIGGNDGRPLLQIRVPMGIQQLECVGRPDGACPYGATSLLDHFLLLAKDDPHFILTSEDTQELIHEGLLYYQRYLAFYELEDWESVIRDTMRNLRYFDFVRQYAAREQDAMVTEQYRPYLIRMIRVAEAQLLRTRNREKDALNVLYRAEREIEELAPVESQIWELEKHKSIAFIKQLIELIEKQQPESRLKRLIEEKEEAVARQDFERAALLRDKIREMQTKLKDS